MLLFTACGNKNETKSEEALRAEIKAELEAEMKNENQEDRAVEEEDVSEAEAPKTEYILKGTLIPSYPPFGYGIALDSPLTFEVKDASGQVVVNTYDDVYLYNGDDLVPYINKAYMVYDDPVVTVSSDAEIPIEVKVDFTGFPGLESSFDDAPYADMVELISLEGSTDIRERSDTEYPLETYKHFFFSLLPEAISQDGGTSLGDVKAFTYYTNEGTDDEKLFKEAVDAIYEAGYFINMGEGDYYIEASEEDYTEGDVSSSVKELGESLYASANTEDLEGVIDYFNSHIATYSQEEKEAFAVVISDKLSEIKWSLEAIEAGGVDSIISAVDSNGSMSLADDAYKYYKFSNSAFDLAGIMKEDNLHEANKNVLRAIKDNKFFTLAYEFWATDGAVDPLGFTVTLEPAMYEKLKDVISLVYGIEEYYASNNFPNLMFESVEATMNSGYVYPRVLLHDFEESQLFVGAETWKYSLLLPVEFVEGQ